MERWMARARPRRRQPPPTTSRRSCDCLLPRLPLPPAATIPAHALPDLALLTPPTALPPSPRLYAAVSLHPLLLLLRPRLRSRRSGLRRSCSRHRRPLMESHSRSCPCCSRCGRSATVCSAARSSPSPSQLKVLACCAATLGPRPCCSRRGIRRRQQLGVRLVERQGGIE